MDIGIGMNTHGVVGRDGDDTYFQSTDGQSTRTLELARRSEELGFHSVWFPDHVAIPLEVAADYPVNRSGRSGYEAHPSVLDTVATMAAVAAQTTEIRLGSSVLIAPYRHPLAVAKELATVDVLSGGRLIFGVSAGWMEEEFRALGIDFERRGEITEECLEICTRAWKDGVVEFHGSHFDFPPISMAPTPVQSPRPPIIYGASSRAGSRRAARHCDGLYPMFIDPASSADQHRPLVEAVYAEGRRRDRDLESFAFMALVCVGFETGTSGFLRGPPQKLVEDFRDLAANGFSHCTVEFEVPSGSVDELFEIVDRFAVEVLPIVRPLEAQQQVGAR